MDAADRLQHFVFRGHDVLAFDPAGKHAQVRTYTRFLPILQVVLHLGHFGSQMRLCAQLLSCRRGRTKGRRASPLSIFLREYCALFRRSLS